ncbi:L,D-transpeptidase family protein [Sphingomonas sp. G124]|uniref:L,D-transpeptidase family protein n=1 Tax=Sphingomonas cremea TaxID=2904799 RepID=A0A9X1QHD2_9SPHN|nr:L,D-transpeptidase family protein [Sphingomonas cremea]MCF2513465.1 L,D-transpeptidase family protein [Sphingomonas cremea]
MKKLLTALSLTVAAPTAALAQAVEPAGRPILEVVPTLKAGQFVWAPDAAAEGPGLLIVNLATQRAILFRNGVPIGASSVSTGRPGYETPTGVFTILEKQKVHHSRTYDNAPMPNMQRLTWKGIALHAGNLPGYPASHGCIRLPPKFSALLFDATRLGMTVIITSLPVAPQQSAPPDMAAAIPPAAMNLARAPFEWHPERSTKGPVSVIVSAADQRAVVLRNGVEIGSAPVRVSGEVKGGWAYALRSWDDTGQHWLKLQFSGPGGGMEVSPNEGDRFDAPWDFRHNVQTVLRPGSIIVVTPQTLQAGSSGSALTVIENEGRPR